MFILEAVHSAICRVLVTRCDVLALAVVHLDHVTGQFVRDERTAAAGAVTVDTALSVSPAHSHMTHGHMTHGHMTL